MGANLFHSDIVVGMDVVEMEESFEGHPEDNYHPFKNGDISLDD